MRESEFARLSALRRTHPAWRFMLAESAPLVASFLRRAFVEPNRRGVTQAELVELLEDELFALRQSLGEQAFPRLAREYLDDWAADERGWLRKFYPPEQDEPHYDLTPPMEKALGWLNSLTERSFVGTESRLKIVFELVREILEGAETDPETRLRELTKRRVELDREIARVRDGDFDVLDDSALRDRFQQLASTAWELLGDFREVEHNFRALDRRVRERIALWEGGKGELLEDILGQRDAISESDQGRSFQAFWDFLMLTERQEQLSIQLDEVLKLPAVASSNPDARLRRIHYDWLEAGEHTQRTIAQLSQQLRRFLDDQAWLENRRIMEILHQIERHALAVRPSSPPGTFMSISETGVSTDLPFERPLFSPPVKPMIVDRLLEAGDESIDTEILYQQIQIDRARLASHVRHALQQRGQISLGELVELNPLQHGLAELITYLTLAAEDQAAVFDESSVDQIYWQDNQGAWKAAELPRVIFVRK